MNTISINSQNSKTSDLHGLLLNLYRILVFIRHRKM